jgi:cell division protein FtsL
MTQHRPDDPRWIPQAFRQAPWRTQTQATSLVLAVVVIVAVIGALYLAQASRTATIGRRLQELESERQRLEQQNAQLQAEIAGLQSVPRLINQAQEMGYHTATSNQVEYLPVNIAPPQATPAAALAETEESVPRYDETLEGWLSQRLNAFRVQVSDFWTRTFAPVDEEGTPSPTVEVTETPSEATPPLDEEP